MDFDFSIEQQQLRELVRRWADKDYGFERRMAIVQRGGFERPVLAELASLGLSGLTVDEAHGGLGLGPVEAMLVMEELGRALLLEPFAQACLMAPAVLRHAPAEVQAQWLPAIASGEALVVLAHQEPGVRYERDTVRCEALAQGSGWRISGTKRLVPAGDRAQAFVVPARVRGADEADGVALFLVDAAARGVSTRGYALQDGQRAGDLRLDQSTATLLVPASDGPAVLGLALDSGIAALAAEAVGVMEHLLGLTTEYLNTRRQFGAPLASFQALRHQVADCKMELELARSMSYYGTLQLGAETAQRRRALAQVKVQLGRSMRFVGQTCVQLHGGIGMTWEYAGSHCFKRLTCMELLFGDTQHHLGAVCALMQDEAGAMT